jgi:hypothetical protein
MIKNQEPKRIHKSTYYKVETDNLIANKSQEFQLPRNKITELCIQKFLPEMKLSLWN